MRFISHPSAPATALVVSRTVVGAGVAHRGLSLERSIVGVAFTGGSSLGIAVGRRTSFIVLPGLSTIGTTLVTRGYQPAANAIGVKVGPAGAAAVGQLVVRQTRQSVETNGTIGVSIDQGAAIVAAAVFVGVILLRNARSHHGGTHFGVGQDGATDAAGAELFKEDLQLGTHVGFLIRQGIGNVQANHFECRKKYVLAQILPFLVVWAVAAGNVGQGDRVQVPRRTEHGKFDLAAGSTGVLDYGFGYFGLFHEVQALRPSALQALLEALRAGGTVALGAFFRAGLLFLCCAAGCSTAFFHDDDDDDVSEVISPSISRSRSLSKIACFFSTRWFLFCKSIIVATNSERGRGDGGKANCAIIAPRG